MGSALIRIFERPFYRKLHQPGEIGTTSACAENTPAPTWWSGHYRNYLRVRGEYITITATEAPTWELPPCTRRIPALGNIHLENPGTTSVYAENTQNETSATIQIRNYLRVRGEYIVYTFSNGLL